MTRTGGKILVVAVLAALFLGAMGSLHPDSKLAFALACLGGGILIAVSLLLFRRTDRALKEREALLRAFIHALPDAGFILDEQGRYVEVMAPPEGLYGAAEEEKRGRRIHDLFPPETADRLREVIRKTIETDRPQTVAYEVNTGEGIRRYEGRTSPIPARADGGPRLVVWIARDVTDRMALEEQLRQAEKMHAIGQLAGGVAHDFNNQLGGIMGYADLLAMRNPDDDGLVKGIIRSARRAADLTQQLLAFSRKGKYLSEPVDLHHTIEEILSLLDRSIDKRIRIERDLQATRPFVLGDPTQLQSALLNMALNAKDAMPDGGTLTFATEDVDPRTLRITVADTGVGMDEETRRRMFEPFFTTKERGRGTGMGLAAVFGTVEAHGGSIEVDSRPGGGTRIVVRLPSTTRGPSTPAESPESPVASGGGRVLVVDDEPSIREVAGEMLEELGYEVRLATNGREALEIFQAARSSIDLVLLDLVMPEMDGRETFARLREMDPGVRVVLSSGFTVDGNAESMLRDGARGFLQKPYEIDELGSAVAAAMR